MFIPLHLLVEPLGSYTIDDSEIVVENDPFLADEVDHRFNG